jgi:hypothetical protein
LEEKPKTPTEPLITKNFPKTPESPKSIFIDHNPVILHQNPTQQDNSLSTKKTITKTPEISINEISPEKQEKFLLDSHSKKTDQLKISQPLTLTASQEPKSTQKELILLQKIKLLEEQLRKTTTERNNLKQLAHSEKQRADQAEQQLQTITQQLGQGKTKTEAKIIQPLP